ncbi:RNA polymerase sigma-70 factor [Saccharothrix texasensis]|uniref:RNA polymerase sigma-70 factor (ECF subfamily) n=1 Tax=Saccharothrix texasensis TaxID=103734 RepID=A0A3N1H1I0_9PSEU|nr:RNA polymerase sigma-70 factor [Saccharothrix texasensis]ROP36380.1 RNA polymerase sigma-70 factor (ECF subfamily) [Saccharothrix texasensis]
MDGHKVALVTGANKGIGRGVAGRLAALGSTVLLGARDRRRGEEAAAALGGGRGAAGHARRGRAHRRVLRRRRPGGPVTRAEEFEELRPLLFSIAYRILGSVVEAEDAVQETWLRHDASPTRQVSTQAFLPAVVTRISIDVLRSARVRREEYVGPWFPEPLLTDPYQDPERSAEPADSLSVAALLLLERLSPLERAVFVLREVFGFGFPEVATAVDRSEAACRQLAVRARRHVDDGLPRFDADRRGRDELAGRFFAAFRDGDVDVDGVRELLAADVHLVGDAGGRGPRWAADFVGAEEVARVLVALVPPFARIGGVVEPRRVNGEPGAVFRDRDGEVVDTRALDVLDGRVRTIRTVVDPDELGHVGPVADAWAVLRETTAVRRGRGCRPTRCGGRTAR